MHRRCFVKNAGSVAALSLLNIKNAAGLALPPEKIIRVAKVASDFERETLLRPFGFKGGYMTEMWQTASRMESEGGISRTGICTQNVLYSEADVFAAHSEAGGNALMFSLTDKALQMAKDIPFSTPVQLIDQLLPLVYEEGRKLTGRKELNKIFALNALVGPDNAAWLLYAAENNFADFSSMIPAAYQKALSNRNKKVAIIYLASYNLPIIELKKAVGQGYFVIKIKIGQPGTQEEMLQKDIARLTEVHNALKEARTRQTQNGKLWYTLDANTRYEKKETFMRLIDAAKKTGAFEQILFVEEPLVEANNEHVGDIGIRIAADESAHDEAGALRRFEQGYTALALKGIAKTLSLSMKMARLAHEQNIPCLCADLTVNPILIDWHKNLAARIAPFPGVNMGLMETNGDLNYRNWETMVSYHPFKGASWTKVTDGVFDLGDDFYKHSGGIFKASSHYEEMFKKGIS